MRRHSGNSQPRNTKWLTIEDFEFLCFDFTREYLTYNEPIPDYSTRDNSLLESSLGSPRQTFNGRLLYPTLIDQGAILFYSLIKNHPFRNGNKRIAVISLLAFLALNKKWIRIPPLDLYKIARYVSMSSTRVKDKVLNRIKNVLKKNIKDFPQNNNDHVL